MVANINPLTEKLLEVRAQLAQVRREAFMDKPVIILGFELQPITLKTHNWMIGTGNAFSIHGMKVSFRDIAWFIWLHHPKFCPSNLKLQANVFKQVRRRVFPPYYRINDWLRLRFKNNLMVKHFVMPLNVDRIAEAIAEIRRQKYEALHDFPRGSEDGEPLPCAHQAYILDSMRRLLQMPFCETENMPLKRLSQHLREIIYHKSDGKAMQMTEVEAAIWAEDLERKTAFARTDEAIKAEKDKIAEIAQRRQKELGYG